MAGFDRFSRPERGPTVEQLAQAVALCYDDSLNDEVIARELAVTRRTLARWKHHPLWQPMYLAASAFFRLQLDRKFYAEEGLPWPRSRLLATLDAAYPPE